MPSESEDLGARPAVQDDAWAATTHAVTWTSPPTIQDAALLAGIAAYRRHPQRRSLIDPPCIWNEGDTRLLDYGLRRAAVGPAVLFVPSLVNRAHILDLAPGHSLLRYLADQGVRPLLLDWGWPGAVERRFTLTDYIAGRLERALAAIGPPQPVLAGYCMGGLLAVAAAQRRPDLIAGLALLATPWDFHAVDRDRAVWASQMLPLLEPVMAFSDTLPVDLLQTMFTLLDPFGVGDKYRVFGRTPQDSPRARLFVDLEDWLNDGVPLVAPVARECLLGWYGNNTPMRGAWHVAGWPVVPSALRMPSFVAAPSRDRIVPPQSALALAGALPGCVLHQPASGHVGMVAGRTAQRQLWEPMLGWLRGLAQSRG